MAWMDRITPRCKGNILEVFLEQTQGFLPFVHVGKTIKEMSGCGYSPPLLQPISTIQAEDSVIQMLISFQQHYIAFLGRSTGGYIEVSYY